MTGKGLWSGVRSYLGALLAVILFPILWAKALRFARRHKADDPRGVAKVGVAIVVGLVILGGVGMQFAKFQSSATRGMYTSLDKRLSAAIGEQEYQDKVQTVGAADVAIPIIQRNLANATAANQTDKAADLQKALNDTVKSRSDAAAKVAQLAPNHQLYDAIQPAVHAQDDAAIKSAIAAARWDYPAHTAADSAAAFAMKDQSVHDMRNAMWFFLWPSLTGAFFAPLAFALGSILRKSFVPSDTVGFKPYPGGAAGFFLLFGAFGLPSIPFAAWTFLDLERRSAEGQIAL